VYWVSAWSERVALGGFAALMLLFEREKSLNFSRFHYNGSFE
jgi:hypothetical protein